MSKSFLDGSKREALKLMEPLSYTLFTEGNLAELEPCGSLIGITDPDMEMEILGMVKQAEYQKEVLNALINTPPTPVPVMYLDGRQVWKGADGSIWRFNSHKSKWICTLEGKK